MSVTKNTRNTQRDSQYLGMGDEQMVVINEMNVAKRVQSMRMACRFPFAVLTAVFLAFLTGCTQNTGDEAPLNSYLSGSLQVGARELRYNLVGGGQVTTSGSPLTALVTFASGCLTFDGDFVNLDNGHKVQVPEIAANVRVHFNQGCLRIFADGIQLHKAMYGDAIQ
jgi:hypothetical protein